MLAVNYSWEQRKLGDIFEEYSEKGHPELPALTIIQGGGTIRRDESDRNLQYDKANLTNFVHSREALKRRQRLELSVRHTTRSTEKERIRDFIMPILGHQNSSTKR